MFEKRLFVEDICYVMRFKDNNEFELFIDFLESKSDQLYRYDPFEKWDEPRTEISHERINSRSIFRVKKFAMEFIESALKKENPYYFSFSAIHPETIKVYKKLAEKISKSFHYSYYQLESSFTFYCNPPIFNLPFE
jgi:hypothetical protein